MKKFFTIIAVAIGLVMFAGCGKSEQDFVYVYDGNFVGSDLLDNDVVEVRKYLSNIGISSREDWIISASSRNAADGEALKRCNAKISKIDESKFFAAREKFRFTITLTYHGSDETVVLKKQEYGNYQN